MFQFKEEFVTGVDFIDNEHKKLFELTQETYDIFMDKFMIDKYDHIVRILNELRDYTKYHFKHEEEFMDEIGYKKRFTHMMLHNEFAEKLEDYDFEKMDYDQAGALVDLLNFLYEWLTEHIAKADKEVTTYYEQSK